MARENSFLTVNLNDEESFRDNLSELSELYEQECFLYKKSGYDTPAVYVYNKDVDEYQKGGYQTARKAAHRKYGC